jgi:hypothetical protein
VDSVISGHVLVPLSTYNEYLLHEHTGCLLVGKILVLRMRTVTSHLLAGYSVTIPSDLDVVTRVDFKRRLEGTGNEYELPPRLRHLNLKVHVYESLRTDLKV